MRDHLEISNMLIWCRITRRKHYSELFLSFVVVRGPKKINLVKGRTPLFFEEFHGWMGVYQTSSPFGVVGWSRQMGAEVEVKARLRSHLLETHMSPIDLILNVYSVDKALKTTIS
jgi:hypothetical protein